ncbi:hypothetical protein [Streptomyces sp. TRM68367]|uniref:hypothetical protein n=1 Tax=Streptomyces sp. TRM68367 TaxID=2758415 RepID=UPI00165AA2B4|nr:hypothetical protein [Streptomyces sp. TRM68367]MBC9728847.1 hypothetical protein [Streptomyces sp. TRM68367]
MLPYERRLLHAIREVRESPFCDVKYEQVGAGGTGLDPTGIFEMMAEEGFPLTERLKEAYFPYRYMALHWISADPEVSLVGDFSVMNIDTGSERKLLNLDDFAWYESDKALLSELSILDDISRGGSGQLATMRFLPGVSSPEIWYLDRFHTFVKLDLDYRDYLDNLIITKGVIGWQYLFADVSLNDSEFSNTLDNIKIMLRVFPEHFPDYDYAPLQERLEARL